MQNKISNVSVNSILVNSDMFFKRPMYLLFRFAKKMSRFRKKKFIFITLKHYIDYCVQYEVKSNCV